MEVDAVSPGLFFAAQQAAASETAKAKKQEKTKRRGAFASALEKSQAEYQMKMDGLPPEIAGMEPEEAVVFLKDAADLAAERLKSSQMPDVFADYRQKVSQFMRYIVKYNYRVESHDRAGRNRLGRKLAPHQQVVMINQKLDEMARWLLSSHKETLHMLSRLEEINGMLVDLMAA